MRNSQRFIVFRSHALAFMVALSPAFFQTVYSCDRGDTYLLSLQFEVGGQNLVQGFQITKRSGYGVVTHSTTATLTVETRFEDSTATYQWQVGGFTTDAQLIGIGGGTVPLDLPRGQSQLLVCVRAGPPDTAVGCYTVDVNRVDTDSCVANSTGDPHLLTFDRLHYDLQTVGEYVLTRSTLGGYEIQARTSPWGTSRVVSVNIAFAADVGGDIVSLYLGDPDIFINHQRVSLSEREKVDLPQGGSVERFRAVTEVVWPTGEIAQITRHGSYLNLQAVVPIAGGTNLVGLFGSCDGDPTNDLWPRDAISPLEQPVTFNALVYVFGNSWRILQGESLFEDVGVTDPSFPDSGVTSADLPQALRDAAETFCLDQGVLDPVLLEDCILDYGLTGDESFAEVYSSLFPPVDALTMETNAVIIAANDEWTLSDTGFSNAPDAAVFAGNIAALFTNDGTANIHAYSNSFAFTGSQLLATLQDAGHSYGTGTAFPFELDQLAAFDGIFLGGFLLDATQIQVLIGYVRGGGNVYLAGGHGSGSAEPNAWNPFLGEFGLQFASTTNGIGGNVDVSGATHPVFAGVSALYQLNGHSISGPGVQVVLNGHGLYAVIDTP